MAGYEEVVDVPLAFKVVCLSMVRYNKQDLHALVRTIGKRAPTRRRIMQSNGRNSEDYNATQSSELLPRRRPQSWRSLRNDIYQSGLSASSGGAARPPARQRLDKKKGISWRRPIPQLEVLKQGCPNPVLQGNRTSRVFCPTRYKMNPPRKVGSQLKVMSWWQKNQLLYVPLGLDLGNPVK